VLVFTNTGSAARTLYGYPGAGVTENGSYDFSPRVNATRVSGGAAVQTVTLAPGSSASAVLEWAVTPTGGGTANAANCPGMDGGYLEVTPPNTTDTIKSDPPLDMCTDLQVFPVVAGTAGRRPATRRAWPRKQALSATMRGGGRTTDTDAGGPYEDPARSGAQHRGT
jgi:hypothetical protein